MNDGLRPRFKVVIPIKVRTACFVGSLEKASVGGLFAMALVTTAPWDDQSCRQIIVYEASCSSSVNDHRDGRRARLLDEHLHLVCSYLEANSLCKCAQLNHDWGLLSERDCFWEHLTVSQFNLRPSSFTPPPEPVKRLYEQYVKVPGNM